MKSGHGGCPLLLLSFVGLLFFAGQLPGTSGQNATEKAGTCPRTETVTTSGNCTEECQSDAHCEENQKCCPAGCGTSCQVPDDKPGSCPKFAGGISSLGFCMDKCMKDSDCDDNAKCCQNGCGKRSCLSPDL
ncbi:PREDICTED: waprin-Phi1-like [Gekko japonicus]|uniref:Waprin-Phi1-like n=1 Tax=Gekko japonicus TaxID=146911 RepID=A0ABM1KD58_GEKJA|nr:PREDICTED: waprin-Phi1-like [Gekko japonicus]